MDGIADLNDLRLFAEVVGRGSFTAAANALGAQTSKLSRRVRALEEELGVRLLNRTSRSLSLTQIGRQFHQHCLAMVEESKAARQIIDQTRSKPQGTVRISCPLGLLTIGVAEMISRFLQKNPEVQVLLDATNRRVDVIEEGLDFAIRVRLPPLENADLAVRQLGQSSRILVASPILVKRYGSPKTIDGLRDWPTISMASTGERYVWELVDAGGQTTSWSHKPTLATDDLGSMKIAAIQGIGVAMLPQELVEDEIAAGRLRRLLPEVSTSVGIVHAIFPSRRGMVPAVRTLMDSLAEGFAERQRASEPRRSPGKSRKA